MIQAEALKKAEPLEWSLGSGVDVWEMLCACLAGDLPAVKRLLDEDPSLVRSHHAYRTPLYFAVRENRIEVVAFLLEHGALPFGLTVNDSLLEICRDRGYAEHWAVMTRQIEVIDQLLASGADIDAARSDGARPIQLTNGEYNFRGWRDVPPDWPTTPAQVLAHLRARGAFCDIGTACHVGDLDRVRELLDRDPSLANRVSDYVTYYLGSGAPLRNAVANRHLEIARLLLEHGAFPNPEVESSGDALSRAISNSDQPMIDLLCSHGAARALHLLAYSGDVQTAAAVLAANPALADDPDALANAAGEGHEPFVRLLLRYQPDLPKRIAFPAWSVGARTRELNELLFEHGMSPSQPDWLHVTPLHQFARKRDLDRAAQFIDHGADLHARDEDICSTPLGWAAKYGQLPMVKLLLQRGARPSLSDDPPWATPLAWATRRGHPVIGELLARHAPR